MNKDTVLVTCLTSARVYIFVCKRYIFFMFTLFVLLKYDNRKRSFGSLSPVIVVLVRTGVKVTLTTAEGSVDEIICIGLRCK